MTMIVEGPLEPGARVTVLGVPGTVDEVYSDGSVKVTLASNIVITVPVPEQSKSWPPEGLEAKSD